VVNEDRRWHGTPVLVTGAQGFIGAWLAERLLDEGARVVAPLRDVDPGSRFRVEGIAGRCEVVQADVSDYESVLAILNEYAPKAVFHLAAQPIVGIANRAPHSTFESNVGGTYTLLEACRARGTLGDAPERIVVASSDHAYGAQDELPFREDFGLRALYPYDVSKACTDMIARCYATTYDMPVAVTRLANVYGGGDENWSRIVPDTSRALVEGRRPVIRSDGTPERDYMYVKDAVDVYLTVAASLDDPALWGRAWNAGHGKPVSVLEVVRRLTAVSGKELEPDVRGRGTPDGEIDRQYIDPTAIRVELGWTPTWDLEDGLAEAYAWYERYLSGSRSAAVTSSVS
jgi:CDP-glucose 4,6-dehydratase